uniref:Ig-like domain-containing protein n=1 Tax=Oreochromis aureus TaxID=47969 RepID=A0A668ULS8_OREAU
LSDGKIIKAEPGQNVTLPCQTPHISVPIRTVEWFRLDLQEGHVLMYQDEQFISLNQLPSFVNRVDLQDRQMKDGDVSLILKDVTSDDTGTFQCYVVQRGTNGRKSIVDHISTIYLRVVGIIHLLTINSFIVFMYLFIHFNNENKMITNAIGDKQ